MDKNPVSRAHMGSERRAEKKQKVDTRERGRPQSQVWRKGEWRAKNGDERQYCRWRASESYIASESIDGRESQNRHISPLTLQWHCPLVLLQSGSNPLAASQLQGPHVGFPHQPLGHCWSILQGKKSGGWIFASRALVHCWSCSKWKYTILWYVCDGIFYKFQFLIAMGTVLRQASRMQDCVEKSSLYAFVWGEGSNHKNALFRPGVLKQCGSTIM